MRRPQLLVVNLEMEWQRSAGGSDSDQLWRLEPLADGGCVLAGYSYSLIGGSKTTTNFGRTDFWLARLDAAGRPLWDRDFGDMSTDDAYALCVTTNGDYVLAGPSYRSYMGILAGNKTSTNYGRDDGWLVRVDAATNKSWDLSFGGTNTDVFRAIRQTADGGFILCGYSESGPGGNKTSANFGGYDAWVVRLNSDGAYQWDKSFGGTNGDAAYDVWQTSDGGFLVSGYSDSPASGNKSSTNFGGSDAWLVRLDANGNWIWDKSFGGTGVDTLMSLHLLKDGGCIFAAYSSSGADGNKTTPLLGSSDVWVVRLDAGGNILWQQTLGGPESDTPREIAPTSDGGYFVAGISSSGLGDAKSSPNFGGGDGWLVRLDADGQRLWDYSFGGLGSDSLIGAREAADGGVILAGSSDSLPGGNKFSPRFGSSDFWIIKLGAPQSGPGFLTHPQSLSVLEGSNATFAVHALGIPPLTCQWYHDGAPVPGGTNVTLALPNVRTNDAGDYWLVVTNAFNPPATSAVARLTVLRSPPSGLVAWWPGDGNPQDLVAGNNGVGQGGVFYSPAQVGPGFTFDSDDDRVVVSHRSAFNPANPGFSVHFWMKGNKSQPQSLCTVVEKSHGFADYAGWAVQVTSASGRVGLNFGDGSSAWPGVQSTADVLDNAWHHLAGTWDGTTIRLYVDAMLQGTAALSSPANNTRAVNLGFAWGGGTAQRFFRGQIDEVSIHNRALSSDEVAAIRATGTNGFCKSAILPVLLVQPANTNALQGQTVRLSSSAGGSTPLSFQWLKNSAPLTNGGNVSGATTAALTLTSVQTNDAGNFQIVVTNLFSSVTSIVATLTVDVPLTLSDALDAPSLGWAVGGTPSSVAMWFGQRTNTHDTIDAAQSGAITHSQANRFQTTVMGPGTISFWWKVGSEEGYDKLKFAIGGAEKTNISGSVNWRPQSFAVPAGAQALTWEYSKDASDTVLPDAGWVDEVQFTPAPPPMPLAAALDTTNLAWTTTGDALWFGQTNLTHDGTDAAQSGEIGQEEETAVQTTVTGPGILRFWWKVSSEIEYDWLDFWIEGSNEVGISGEWEWQEEVFALPSGNSTLKWVYSKDDSGWDGADAGWLDEVRFTPTQKPLIGRSPQPQSAMVGDLAQFDVVVAGVEPLVYQWYRNQGALPGATNVSLRLQPVHLTDPGQYTVVITNSFGSATSAPPAGLTLLPFELQWQRSFGGTNSDASFAILQTADGGFLVGGWSDSTNGHRAGPHFGDTDFWAVRIGAGGDLIWENSFGGSNSDNLHAVVQTADGGFLLAGTSSSGADGNKTNASFGSSDFWIVRTDSAGHKLWDRAYGGTGSDDLWRVRALPDGSFLLGGSSSSPASGNKTSPNFGGYDFWLVHVDAKGDPLWDRSFGGTDREELRVLERAADGGLLLAGYSESPAGTNKTSPCFGGLDFWLVRADANGNKVWEASFGGSGPDFAIAAQPATNGGWIVGGVSASETNGNKTSPAFGGDDSWLVHVDTNGVKVSEQSYGGVGDDYISGISGTADGGILLAGQSDSGVEGTKTRSGFGDSDVWLVCADASGQQIWDYSFGGTDDDWPNAILATADGGFLVAGASWSDPDGNKTTDWLGVFDFWLIKLRPQDGGSTPLRLDRADRAGTNFCFWFQTESNQHYTVEYKDDLRTTNWVFHHTMTGDGSLMPCLIPMTNTTQRFFRVRQP